MFHDFEEILTVEAWGEQTRSSYNSVAFPRIAEADGTYDGHDHQGFCHGCAVRVYSDSRGNLRCGIFLEFYWPYLAVLAVFLLHVFTHLAQSMVLKLYTPGVVTAVLLAFSVFLVCFFYRLLHEGIVSEADIGWSLLLLLILTPPLVWGLMKKRTRHKHSEE
ncbi:HXXEE domain-containing protein [Paenibacillus rhizoplanae]